jgi:hypothetical protein
MVARVAALRAVGGEEQSMATSHFARTVYQGRSTGNRAALRVAYIMRRTGTQEDLVYARAQNLPDFSADDPAVFFQAAEHYGSPAWTAYEEWKFALPRELNQAAQLAAARGFLQSTFGDTHPYVWAMHEPVAADGERQAHVHVLWSARTLDGIERSPSHFFMRANGAHPERGGAPKARELDHMGAVKAARVQYTDVMNLHLERAGSDARLHPDRLEARGLMREPEPRLDPRDSRAFKERGEVTAAMQQVLDHRKRYAIARAREQRLAVTYWEERKRELGLTRAMEPDRGMQQIRDARVQRVREAPAYARQESPGSRVRGRDAEVAEWQRLQRLTLPLVGNCASMIFHAPGDPNYGDVNPRKQVLFWTMADAEEAGYRAAVNQHYGRGSEQRREEGVSRGQSREGRGRARQDVSRHSAVVRDQSVALSSIEPPPEDVHGQAVRVRVFEEERRGRRGY